MINDLSEEITKAESIPVFKRKIKIWLKMVNFSGTNFDIRDHSHRGFFGKVLIQMRFELSPLRSHLFKYNLTDNPFCPACGDFFETTDHYFFECSHYAVQRRSLLIDIAGLDGALLSQSEMKKFILFGSSNKNLEQRIKINKLLFKFVATFLYTTRAIQTTAPINLEHTC